ncbi:MAG: hypothetical protein II126_05665, partial [Erysipelotrichaceae bacterium]|nr:hypothetical protein [Erysipelotrichaceae bacterium]
YLFGLCYWFYLFVPKGISRVLAGILHITKANYLQNIYKMIPYLVTIIVLVLVSTRKKRENQAPASLGVSYFREER